MEIDGGIGREMDGQEWLIHVEGELLIKVAIALGLNGTGCDPPQGFGVVDDIVAYRDGDGDVA